jgi:hypothetical protein
MYLCLDDLNQNNDHADAPYRRGQREYVETQAPNGLFIPYRPGCLEGLRPENMGMLLYKDIFDDTAFIILKPAELLHDVSAGLWLKTDVQCRYPQDAAGIARDFPQLYRELTKRKEHWREIEPMEEAPAPYRFGSAEMYVPCDYIENYWGMKKGPFQFAVRDNGLQPLYGPNRDHFTCTAFRESYAVSFINRDGREYFVLYRIEGMKRYKKEPYAWLRFHKMIPLADVLDNGTNGPNGSSVLGALNYAYHFHTCRDALASAPADEETFDELDTMRGTAHEADDIKLLAVVLD